MLGHAKRPSMAMCAYITMVIAFFAVASVFIWRTESQVSFDAVAWKTNRESRSKMAKDLLKGGQMLGLSHDQLTRELGPPDDSTFAEGDGHVLYWIDHQLIDDLWLDVHLINGVVKTVTIRPD